MLLRELMSRLIICSTWDNLTSLNAVSSNAQSSTTPSVGIVVAFLCYLDLNSPRMHYPRSYFQSFAIDLRASSSSLNKRISRSRLFIDSKFVSGEERDRMPFVWFVQSHCASSPQTARCVCVQSLGWIDLDGWRAECWGPPICRHKYRHHLLGPPWMIVVTARWWTATDDAAIVVHYYLTLTLPTPPLTLPDVLSLSPPAERFGIFGRCRLALRQSMAKALQKFYLPPPPCSFIASHLLPALGISPHFCPLGWVFLEMFYCLRTSE